MRKTKRKVRKAARSTRRQVKAVKRGATSAIRSTARNARSATRTVERVANRIFGATADKVEQASAAVDQLLAEPRPTTSAPPAQAA